LQLEQEPVFALLNPGAKALEECPVKSLLTLIALVIVSSSASASMFCKAEQNGLVGVGPAMVYVNGEYRPVDLVNGRQQLGILYHSHYYYPAKCTINGCTYRSNNVRMRFDPKNKRFITQRPGKMPTILKLTKCSPPNGE
jgi:hypothetical protein